MHHHVHGEVLAPRASVPIPPSPVQCTHAPLTAAAQPRRWARRPSACDVEAPGAWPPCRRKDAGHTCSCAPAWSHAAMQYTVVLAPVQLPVPKWWRSSRMEKQAAVCCAATPLLWQHHPVRTCAAWLRLGAQLCRPAPRRPWQAACGTARLPCPAVAFGERTGQLRARPCAPGIVAGEGGGTSLYSTPISHSV